MRLLRTPTLDLATPENALAPEVKERKVIIDLKDVKKVYQMGDLEVHALQGVNLKIYEGEFVSIMGPSGSGKSTLMNILGVLDQPTHGEYYLDGVNVERLRENQLASVRNKKILYLLYENNSFIHFIIFFC